jgi:hypothetical protein
MNLGSALGLSAVGPMFGATALSMGDTIAQGAFSARQASNQMDFQREMSDTAFQRRATDLSAAGLNPILAATQGPAGVPAGAMASTPTSNMASSFFSAANAANSLAQARKTNADAVVSETEAEVARRRLRSLGDPPKDDVGGILDSLPSMFQPSARAIADAIRRFQDDPGSISDFLKASMGGKSDAFVRVEDMLRGKSGPSSAVGARRVLDDAGVTPGGASMRRGVPGQLNRLMLKRSVR